MKKTRPVYYPVQSSCSAVLMLSVWLSIGTGCGNVETTDTFVDMSSLTDSDHVITTGDTALTTTPTETAADDCPDGVTCLLELPFTADLDSRDSTSRMFDQYACAPDTDESGAEFIFRVDIAQAGFLGVAINDDSAGVDIDAHLLSDLDAEACIDRGNRDAGELLSAGRYYIVADTYVASGVEQAGPFTVSIGLTPVGSGSCEMEVGWMDRIGDDGNYLKMPATGPIVMEAHLVTEDDGYGTSSSDPWPQSITESIDNHYAISHGTTALVMDREQPWAPQEGCEYGQGAWGGKLPVEDEGWYVNMYWADRPDAGTRMILMHDSGRAVVVAAGYETGPGDLANIGGTTEEVHHYLGTGHQSELTLGFAVEQALPLGPISCD